MKLFRISSNLDGNNFHKFENLYIKIPGLTSIWADASEAAEECVGDSYQDPEDRAKEKAYFEAKALEFFQNVYENIYSIDISLYPSIFDAYKRLVTTGDDYQSMPDDYAYCINKKETIDAAWMNLVSLIVDEYKGMLRSVQ